MNDWHLRLARAEDAEAMPAVERTAATVFQGHEGLGSFDREATWPTSELRRLIRKGHSLVAHVDEEMSGFLVTEPQGRELHVWEVSVAPKFQQRGIGAGLVRACLIDATNSGFAAVTLTTFRDLPWNGPFYARLGFVETTEHPRLNALLVKETASGLAAERRCAMIRFLTGV